MYICGKNNFGRNKILNFYERFKDKSLILFRLPPNFHRSLSAGCPLAGDEWRFCRRKCCCTRTFRAEGWWTRPAVASGRPVPTNTSTLSKWPESWNKHVNFRSILWVMTSFWFLPDGIQNHTSGSRHFLGDAYSGEIEEGNRYDGSNHSDYK